VVLQKERQRGQNIEKAEPAKEPLGARKEVKAGTKGGLSVARQIIGIEVNQNLTKKGGKKTAHGIFVKKKGGDEGYIHDKRCNKTDGLQGYLRRG